MKKKPRRVVVSKYETKRGTHYKVYVPKQMNKYKNDSEFDDYIQMKLKHVAMLLTGGYESEG